jgi:hypothetical protein
MEAVARQVQRQERHLPGGASILQARDDEQYLLHGSLG